VSDGRLWAELFENMRMVRARDLREEGNFVAVGGGVTGLRASGPANRRATVLGVRGPTGLEDLAKLAS
jgi:hypothetical protein